ncbi:MAG: hypothetical protein JO159_18370 [Acidobacteria bacterium]|nr:hypothetical protein [Acidobacteriota bacterium]
MSPPGTVGLPTGAPGKTRKPKKTESPSFVGFCFEAGAAARLKTNHYAITTTQAAGGRNLLCRLIGELDIKERATARRRQPNYCEARKIPA